MTRNLSQINVRHQTTDPGSSRNTKYNKCQIKKQTHWHIKQQKIKNKGEKKRSQQMYRMDWWTQQRKERVEQIGRAALTLYTTICREMASGKQLCNPGSSARCSVRVRGLRLGGGRWKGGSRGSGYMHTFS